MRARGARRLSRLEPEDPEEVGGHAVRGRIGSGGMGVVYAADSPGGQEYLAVKVVHAEHAADPRFRERFAHEARLLSKVNSASVARFVHADVESEQPWMVTEYVPGPPLRRHVERFGRMRGGMLLGLAVGTAEALRDVHAAGVVHRDLKPGNVVLSAAGPKILDFGIAHAVEEPDPTKWLRLRRMRRAYRERGLPSPESLADERTADHRDRRGTPGWISPEQYRDEPTTEASDVFLWGALVAFAAAAHDPFGRAPVREMARRVVHEEPDLEYLPPGLERLVRAAMAKDPAARPDSVELLRAALASEGPQGGVRTPQDGIADGLGPAAVRGVMERHWTRADVRVPRPPRLPRRRARAAGQSSP
ncbi:serine/threonine protein kinase [Nocardiopsis sp. HNM0947]|uniref:Serine/threonine protein kinase n=1 Tax=Nocardiopsis coralli TaxID=2772213 RepID=A0ABR9P674_9ACTN|nr:serine/threonine-protein kinase [Nocardiopsis coralli]MBE2999346.1 serine/threonine protein kinase [Nocardiopsis coralli]